MRTTSLNLLDEACRGDNSGWTRLVTLYAPVLHSWGRHFGLSEDDATDVVQDVFLTLFERLPEFRYDGERSFRRWLKTICANRARDVGRRISVRMRVEAAIYDQSAPTEPPTPQDELDRDEERRHLLDQAFHIIEAEFSPMVWSAFIEYVIHDRPPTTVAEELNMSVNSVYLAKSRVLRRLRDEIVALWE